jgi:hypothetical protein
MTLSSDGSILAGADGSVQIRIWTEHYAICPEDLGQLFFVGEAVTILHPSSPIAGIPQAAGTAALNASGRAVILTIGTKRYLVPSDRFLAVALGEEIMYRIYETGPDEMEIEILSPRKGGAAS